MNRVFSESCLNTRFLLDEKMTAEKTFSHNLMRADCYKLLAGCFYQPEKVLFQEERVLENLIDLLHEVCSEAQLFAKSMKAFFEKTENQNLAVEYASLFIGPFELKAAPYGSVYLEDSHQIMGQTTVDTMALYEKAGLKVDIKEPADHIAIELEFMHYLILAEIDSLASNDEKRHQSILNIRETFYNQFLGKWIPDFCDTIKKTTTEGYYKALADCLRSFIVSELNNPLELNPGAANTRLSASV